MTQEEKVNEELVEEVKVAHGMNKLYLSGPMTGIEKYNHDLFNRVAAEFRMAGFEVCSPSEFFDGDRTKERHEYMREAFKYLLEADTVVILPGWETSKGARLEIMIAQELNLNLVEYVENDEQQTHIASFTPVEEEEANLGSFSAVEE